MHLVAAIEDIRAFTGSEDQIAVQASRLNHPGTGARRIIPYGAINV